jgi:hypothetical protein
LAHPTFSQLRQVHNHSYGSTLKTDDIKERWLVCLAMLASQQNPDGTTL